MKMLPAGAAVLMALSLAPVSASAAEFFVQVPGIPGEQSTPGFPGAMAVQSLEIAPDKFVIVKSLDSASPAIMLAVANGTVFPSASALLYNSAPSGPPDAALTFQNVIASAHQPQGATLEQDSFAATAPGSMFLELPGITGESSTPGHPGVMQIDSFSLTANQFSITKAVDSASPAIALAIAKGTLFPGANVLFYDAASPAGPPDGIFSFGNIMASEHQLLNGGAVPEELDTFNFASVEPVTSGVPEQGSTLLLLTFSLLGIGTCRLPLLRKQA